jgi:hypothetical protein
VCRARPSRAKHAFGVFRKNSSKVLRVGRDQMISALAPDRPIKRSAYPFCQGERIEVGRSRMPMARNRALNAPPNALSLSWMRYLGAVSQGNASVIWRKPNNGGAAFGVAGRCKPLYIQVRRNGQHHPPRRGFGKRQSKNVSNQIHVLQYAKRR